MSRLIGIIKHLYLRIFYTNAEYARYSGVSIGKNCDIFTRDFGSEPYLITIGDNVQISTNVNFFTHGGGWVLLKEYSDFDYFGKIIIGNNVYIGHGSCILPGVSVGDNVVIGACSVVTKSVPDNVCIAGNPAKVLCSIDAYKEKMLRMNTHTANLKSKEKKNFLMQLPDSAFIKK